MDQPNRKQLGIAIGVVVFVLAVVALIGVMIGKHYQRPIVVKAPDPVVVQVPVPQIPRIVTIGRGGQLTDVMTYEQALQVAKRYSLDVIAGKGKHRRHVTPEQARRIDTRRERVVVVVRRGDKVNLDTLEYIPRRLPHS